MMGQLRNALRAFAFEHDDPHAVVSRLDQLVEGMIESAFATLAYLVVDPHERRVRYVVAGHPPPLITGRRRHDHLPRTRSRAPDRRRCFDRVRGGGRRSSRRARRSCSIPTGWSSAAECRSTRASRRLADIAAVERRRSRGTRRQRPRGADRRQRAAGRHRRAGGPIHDGCGRRPPARAPVDAGRPRRDAGGLRALADAGERGSDDAAEAVLATWEACANAVEHAQSPSESSFRAARRCSTTPAACGSRCATSGQWKPGDGTDRAGPRTGAHALAHGYGAGQPERRRHRGRAWSGTSTSPVGFSSDVEGGREAHMHRPYSSSEAHRLLVDSRPVEDGVAVVRLRGEADLHTAPDPS